MICDVLKLERWPKSAKWQEAYESEISPSCSAGGPLPTVARNRPSFYHSVVGVRTQIWPRIAEIIKHNGYKRLDYWVIIEKFYHLSREKLSLSSSRILNSMGTAGMKIRLGWRNKTKRNWNWSCIFTKNTMKIWVLLTHIFGWGGDETRSHKGGTRKDQWVMMAQKKWLSVVQWVWRAKFS